MAPPPAKRRKVQIQYRDNKRKKPYKAHKKQFLESGQRGFLATCNSNEWDCVKECYNILNQYADVLYGADEGEIKPDGKKDEKGHDSNAVIEEEGSTDDGNDIADDLQKQIKATKEKVKRRFQVVETGVSNCVFIKTVLENPVPLAIHIIEDIAKTKKQASRYLTRLIPVQAVCSVSKEGIVKAAARICDKYFQTEPTTFSIVYNKSYKHNIDRENLIKELATLIHAKNADHKVDLKHPKKTFFIQLLKNLCCLSIVDNYVRYKKYNLIELARAEECPDNTDTEVKDDKEAANDSEVVEAKNAEKVEEKIVYKDKKRLAETEGSNAKKTIKIAADS